METRGSTDSGVSEAFLRLMAGEITTDQWLAVTLAEPFSAICDQRQKRLEIRAGMSALDGIRANFDRYQISRGRKTTKR